MSCPKCKSDKVTEDIQATAADNIPAEITYTCSDCGKWLNFFAYGYWEDPDGPTF